MAGITFQISATLAGLTDVKTVLEGVSAVETGGNGSDPFPFPFQDYSEIVGTDLNGAPIKAGLPRCKWHWDWLTREDYAALKAFEGTCYITTNKGDDTYADYLAVLTIPKEPEPMDGHRIGPVDIEFVQMQVQ